MDIHVDRSGRVWLASARGGLVRVDDAGAKRPAFRGVHDGAGLSSNNAEVITEDADGHLYVGGGRGLDHFDPGSGRVKHFTTADGLAPGLARAVFRDPRGVLWVGMHGGLARLAPPPEKPPAPPEVLIRALRVAGVPQLVSALGEHDMSLRDVAPDRNQLEIEFAGLSFGTGEVLRYQYRLEGADDDWSVPERAAQCHLREPCAGRVQVHRPGHQFGRDRECASGRRDLYHPASSLAALVVSVSECARNRAHGLPPLPLPGRARAGGGPYAHSHCHGLARRYRRQPDTHRAAQRGGEARTRRHGDARGGPPPETPRATRTTGPLASIAVIARESVSSMSDIVWAINPARESLLDLIRRMRQHADQVFTSRDIELRFSAPGGTDNVRLAMDVRRDLLLIFKEAVNNAARHSGCSRAEIDLRVAGSRLVLTLSDNGVGFDTSLRERRPGPHEHAATRWKAAAASSTLHRTGVREPRITLDMPI